MFFTSCKKESVAPIIPEKSFEIIGTLQDSVFVYDTVTIFIQNFDPRQDTIRKVLFDTVERTDFLVADSTAVIVQARVLHSTDSVTIVLNQGRESTIPFVVHFPETNFKSCSIVAPQNNFSFSSAFSGVVQSRDSIDMSYNNGGIIINKDLSLLYFRAYKEIVVFSIDNYYGMPKCYRDRVVYRYCSDTAVARAYDRTGIPWLIKEVEIVLKY